MKTALVLAGGQGSRLRPLTATRSKQLLPVANRPILHLVVERAVAAGATDVVVVVGESGDEIRRSLGDGAAFGARIRYVVQDAPRGLAHAVLVAEETLEGQPFLMYLGDNLLGEDLQPLVRRHEEEGAEATVLLARVREPQRFGVVELENGRVRHLVEKPAAPRSDLALVGVYLFGPRIFEAARSLRPSARGELEITDAIQRLVDEGGHVAWAEVQGWWKDTGRPEDLLEANRWVLRDLATRAGADPAAYLDIHPSAQLNQCSLVGPLVVGPGVRACRAHLGPNLSLGEGCSITDAAVEDSVLLPGVRVEGPLPSLRASLIGRDSIVRSPGASWSFVLGDNCSAGPGIESAASAMTVDPSASERDGGPSPQDGAPPADGNPEARSTHIAPR